jgi:lipopolysaccharide transport system permease protein
LGIPPWTYLLLPLLLFLQGITMLGLGFVLATIGVFFRDIKDFVTLFTTAGIYLMPVVYLPTWVPPLLRPVLYANPFSYMTWCFQDVFFFGRIEHPWAWVIFALFSFFIFAFGYRLFRRLKYNFGNVL